LTKIFFTIYFIKHNEDIFSTEIQLSWELHCSNEKCPTVFLQAICTIHTSDERKPHVARELYKVHNFLS